MHLHFQFGCGPENVDKLIAATKEEINKLKVDGVTELDITKFVQRKQGSTNCI